MSNYVLDGIRVVELATFVFGPAAGTVLGDFGADVIHIEAPGIGDPYRYLDKMKPLPACDVPYCWILTARGKQSIALDLKKEEGREVARELVRRADVFITNYHPSVLEALQMTWEQLAPLNSRLVYAHATGYGDVGDEVEKPGFDATAWWARSGLMDAVRPGGGEFGLATPGMGDHPSAMALFGAIMLALYDRERTGRGQRVRSSLIANGVWSNAIYVQAALCGAQSYAPPTHAGSPNALVNHYTCSDGRALYLAMVQEVQQWGRLCEALGRPDLRNEPRFAELDARRQHSAELTAILDEVFASRPLDEWRRRLDEHDVTFGVIATTDDVPRDPQIEVNELLRPVEGAGGLRTVDSPIHLDRVAKRAPRRAPEIGEHTQSILKELGYSAERIDALQSKGVVRTAD